METYSIKNTTEALEFVFALAEAVEETAKDGFQLVEIAKFIPVAIKAPNAFKDMQEIPKELGELSETEKEELKSVVEGFDIENDRVEVLVEEGLKAALDIAAIVEKLIASIKAAKAE